MTPQELSDHIEITQVIERYFRSMDTRNFDLLESVFTPDAAMNYDVFQGVKMTYRELLPAFVSFTRQFSFLQHIGGQLLIDLSGDTASSSNNLRAIHVQTTNDGEENEWVVYGVYHDQHVRTDAGWRIAERRFHVTRSVGELLPTDRVKTYDTPPWL